MNSKLIPILIAAVALIGGIMFSFNINKSESIEKTPVNISGLLWPNPKQISVFSLIDQNAELFNLDNLQGKWSMMFFGYTHCPDVCPTTMTLLNSVVTELSADEKINEETIPHVIFVTVDPERDTQQHLSEYIAYFNNDFSGLTGSEEELSVLMKQLGILHMKVEDKNSTENENYLMDHSSAILLLDPKARLVGIFSTPHDKEDIKQRYLEITEFISQRN
ncbi:MAG: SCO family protein [Gammaproteobacteria bacterium]